MTGLTHKQLQSIGAQYIKSEMVCNSPYGTERLRKLSAFKPNETDTLNRELDNIACAVSAMRASSEKLYRLEHLFMMLKSIRRSVETCGMGTPSDVTLFEIKRFLIQLDEISPLFSSLCCQYGFDGLHIPKCDSALSILDPDGSHLASFHVSESFSDKLARVRHKKRDIEVLMRKTDSTSTEYTRLENERRELVAQEDEEEQRIRKELSIKLEPHKEKMLEAMDSIGRIDLILAKARLALRYGAVRPRITLDEPLELVNMFNPEIKDTLSSIDREFTPVTLKLKRGATVITGANMGGKSVALKTTALNTLCALWGMFVFAKSAVVPVFENIFLLSEDLEDTTRGLSSFGGEIIQLKKHIKSANKATTLILFDEFARGTNPEEGADIVRALVKYLNKKQATSVLTTHYDGVAEHANTHYRVKGLMSFSPKQNIAPGEDPLAAIAAGMDYSLYLAPPNSPCPQDARLICRFLLHDVDFLDEILKT